MPKQKITQPLLIEKVIAALSYVTMGAVGFIWLLIGAFTKSHLKSYLKYHIFQSIFLSIAYFLFCWFLEHILSLLSFIPFVNQLILQFTFYLSAPLIFGISVIQLLIDMAILYLVITSLEGQYSYIPWISDIIKANVRD